jgi:hypothetical protein
MEYLKEDGSLDVERIRKLPFEEKKHIMNELTRDQLKDIISCLPINESHGPITPIKVDYSMEDLLAKGWGAIDDIYNILMK